MKPSNCGDWNDLSFVHEFSLSKGAFTPDANEALRANDLHVKSMQIHDRQSCGAIHANEVAQIERLGRLTRD